MKREVILFVKDIYTACKDIQDFTAGMELDQFIQDKKTSSAVLRQFEIVGEAAKYLPDDLKMNYPEIRWKDIAGMRDRLIHAYFGVDFHLVWDTVKTDVPRLLETVQHILAQLKREKDHE